MINVCTDTYFTKRLAWHPYSAKDLVEFSWKYAKNLYILFG